MASLFSGLAPMEAVASASFDATVHVYLGLQRWRMYVWIIKCMGSYYMEVTACADFSMHAATINTDVARGASYSYVIYAPFQLAVCIRNYSTDV